AATAGSPTTPVATAPHFREGRLLPQVPGRGGEGLARRPRGRSAAGRLFPSRLYAASRDRSNRLPEQGRVYDLLFRTAAETLLTIAADPRHLGAQIGITAVL